MTKQKYYASPDAVEEKETIEERVTMLEKQVQELLIQIIKIDVDRIFESKIK